MPANHKPTNRFLSCHPAELRHATVQQSLNELQAILPTGLQLEELGKSFEGRLIRGVKLGNGPTKVFAWSQMHGDESTHTAVLLEIIYLLQTQPDSPISRDILEGSTLFLVPLLNPDGAERSQRRNAQDLDVNRDALHLQTPEGRLLHQLVEEFRPDFAFNLHNQKARTSVDGKHPAAVSLLVPPIDAGDTPTASTTRARRVAVAFLEAIQDDCVGMISRYDADFMPRCFGEWVQQQGIATLTVEAGGWTTISAEPLTEVHLAGMLKALHSIATGSYARHDPAEYDALPRSSELELCDVLIQQVQLTGPTDQESFSADVGINFAYSGQGQGRELGGTVVDLGDLRVISGKRLLSGKDWACLPGRIAFEPGVTPQQLPDGAQMAHYLSLGITTLIGGVDLSQATSLRAFLRLPRRQDWPLNLGFVGIGTAGDRSESPELRNLLIECLAGGLLGCTTESGMEAGQSAKLFGLPVIASGDLPPAKPWAQGLCELRQHVRQTAHQLGLRGRGMIQLGAIADLVLISRDASRAMSPGALQCVLVGGRVVWEQGTLVARGSGELVLNLCAAGRPR